MIGLGREDLIGSEARELIDSGISLTPDDQLEPLLLQRPRALRLLEREADNIRRIGWGSACWFTAAAGWVGLALVLWNGAPWWVRAAGLLTAAVLLPTAAKAGRAVWLAGREVTDALVWWTTVPVRLPKDGAGVPEWRASPTADVIENRTWIWQGKRPLRTMLAALSALAAAVFGRMLQDSPRFGEVTWAHGQGAFITVMVIGLLVIGLGAAGIVVGGMQRAINAYTQRDPIQRAILNFFKGLFRRWQ